MRNWSLIATRLERDGGLLPLVKACKLIPAHRGNRSHTSAQTLARWIVNGRNGIFLDGVKAGMGWCTTLAAIVRFLAECSGQAVSAANDVTDMERRAEDAKARMRALGVKC